MKRLGCGALIAMLPALCHAPAASQTLPPVGATTPNQAPPVPTPAPGQLQSSPTAPTSSPPPSSSSAPTQPQAGTSTPPAPSGGPSHPGQVATPPRQPNAAAPASDNTVYLENADLLRLEGSNIAHLTGHVQVSYQDYTLYSDRATIDTQTGRATFDGHVHIVSKDGQTNLTSNAANSQIVLDMRRGSYSVNGAEHAVLAPSLFNGAGILLPLRLDTSELASNLGIIDARQVGFTTCDLADPHYIFGVRSLTVIPGRRLIARHAILYRRGRRIIELPMLILPLNDRYNRASYLPTIGNSPDEGAFVKFAYPYALAAAAIGVIRLDLMQRKGTGAGFDQSYQAHGPGGGGTLSIYRLNDRSRGLQVFTDSLTHRQSLGAFKLNVDTQYQNNSYYSASGASQNLNSRLTFTGSTPTSATLFSTNLQQSNYGTGNSRTVTASLDQQQTFGRRETFDLKMNYSGSLTPGFSFGGASSPSQNRATLASNLGLHLQPSGLRIDVQTDLFSALQNTGTRSLGGFAGLQRRPELLLTTTGAGNDPLDLMARLVRGSQLQLGLGSYIESASSTNTSRLYFGYDAGNQIRQIRDFTFLSDSSFQQSFYGDGGAQYLLNGRYGSVYKRGPLDFGANYSTLRAYGFTPFLFDRPGDYNNASFNLTYTPSRAFDLTAATAYDFLRDRGLNGLPAAPWQNLLAVFNLHPSQYFRDRLQTTYDPNHGTLFDVSNDFQVSNASGFGLHTAFDFIPKSHKFGTVNASLDLPIILDQREQTGYKIQALAGYNGFNSQFTYQGLALTRSWHDWELTATYENNPSSIRAGNTFYLTFHLKALPGYQPFGVGAYGQALSSGIGQHY